MTKKPTNELVDVKCADVRTFDYSPADEQAALQLGIIVGGPAADRINRAVVSHNMAARLALEAGYLLLSVKSDSVHGEFEEAIADAGLSRYRAAELMRTAKFVTSLPESQRADMLTMPKSKVLLLASADADVIEDLLNDEDGGDLDALSVRELRLRIRELQANNADLSVHSDAVTAERDGALKRLNKRNQRDEDDEGVPAVMADLRAELTALLKKGELAMTSLHPVGVDIVNYSGHADVGEWVKPTLRLGLAGLLAQRELIDGSIKSYVEALGEDAERLVSQPDALAFLSNLEIKDVAEEYGRLTAVHGHEAALRQHDRNAAKPQGKGRPAKAPEAPAAAKVKAKK